ncbi:MAG: TonB-dependent receptor [Ideonella sp.]|nr:TonB-dependent receptor [Ideonella sp.]
MAFRTPFQPAARIQRHPLALAAALAAWPTLATAQEVAPQAVTVTGRSSANAAGIAGFGDVPLYRSPFSATVITTGQLSDAGISGLGDLTRLDAGTTDAYNAPGYWGMLAVRGFTLDPQFNYRRDGLPINAETMLPLTNKQGLELLKGTSGLQAGTSAPGGLLNLVVKRPAGHLRNLSLGWAEQDTRSFAIDLGDGDAQLGWRVNAEYTHLRPSTFDSRGHRNLLALAVDAQPIQGTLLEAEFEHSAQQQPSTPGISLLGPRLPDAASIDPRTNLNIQAWRLPVVMQGNTGSLRLTQTLSTDLQFSAHAMRQRLGTDDRIAFPFGCSAEDNYTRYCSDGSFDLYDFRSEGERRTTEAMDLAINGKAMLAGMEHRYSVGLLRSRFTARFNRQAYNWVGVGTLDGLSLTPPDPSLSDENTHRDERSNEWRLQDAVSITREASAWFGLRHSALDRRSVRTDGSRATAYTQSFTTPWLALSHAVGPHGMAYTSWGEGVESAVAPGRSRYTNAGQALPAMKSRQVEAGYKHHGTALDWNLAAFDIRHPEWIDMGTCDVAGSCMRTLDGASRHRGIEADAEWRSGPWSLRGSAMLLKARREGAADASANGARPTNVPGSSLKAQAAFNVAAVPGLALMGFITREGNRMVVPDNSVQTPGWTRIDVDARYTQRLGTNTIVWRAGIDNLANARAWKEAPFQYGHTYLYPLAPRGAHLSAQLSL